MSGYAVARHAEQPLVWTHTLDLTFSFLCFVWYCRDGDARAFIRSRWLNVAMVTFTMLTIPYYLWKTRARAERRGAILRYVGFGVLLGIVAAVGFALGALLA